MRKEMQIGMLRAQAWIWLGLPVALFLGCWMRWWISLPLIGLLTWRIIVTMRRKREEAGWSAVRINAAWTVSVVLIPLVMALLGMGGLVSQEFDYWYRNAVFHDLVYRDWPVVYDGQTPRLLCYYFAYWLPGALVGKWTGSFVAGDLALLLWGSWGAFIAYSLLVSRMGGRARWWHLPFLLLFCLCDRAADTLLSSQAFSFLPFDVGAMYENYMSFPLIEQIQMIFNQALPCWVALPLIWQSRTRPADLLLPCSLLFPFAPLPCVGISTAVLWYLLKGGRSSLSISNLTGLLLIVTTGLFYMTNMNASGVGGSHFGWKLTAVYGIFFFVTAVGIYIPFIKGYILREPAFWLMVVTCYFLPFLMLGESVDLGRRALIPLTILITYCMVAAFGSLRAKPLLHRVAISLLALVGTVGLYRDYWMARIYWDNEAIAEGRARDMGLVGHLDDPAVNDCYANFIAEGDSFYTKHMQRK